MLLLDPRVGSGELLPFFQPYDIEVFVQDLEFADVAWCGNGATGPVLVGVERKVITDLVSSMRSNRLSGHQLPGLLSTYDWVYVLVEGVWRCGEEGDTQVLLGRDWISLRVGSRPVLYRELDHYLATLEHKCGVTVVHTTNTKQTAAWLVSRYKWWTDKEWSQHQSHEAIYAPTSEQQATRRGSFTRRTAGAVEVVAAQFPGVSKKAWEFRKVFSSVHNLFCVEGHCTLCSGTFEKRVEGVEGVGKKGARRIYDWLMGG